jgi:uncharacterized membrane protein YkoI
MMKRLLLSFALPAALLASAAVPPAWADGDHARARAAREAGRILPLERIVEEARRQTDGGVILDVELEDEGRWIYEVKALSPDGRIVKLEYDARTGALLKEKRRRGDDARADR